ncbi:MAG: 50S ribosomal protein L5 [Candidatus Micrarchaeia archaeon]|jgi:large subunit ribosomal protein L5
MAEKKTNTGPNPMRGLKVEKVTINIGAGQAGQVLENAKLLLKKLTGRTPATTVALARNPVFKLRKGDTIGAKVTLRRAPAIEFLKKAFETAGNRLSMRSFDRVGNFSFGIREYIDFPGVKYDPQIGMMGFDVCVTLNRLGGKRVKVRRRAQSKPRNSYAITKEEAMEFVKKMFGVELV